MIGTTALAVIIEVGDKVRFAPGVFDEVTSRSEPIPGITKFISLGFADGTQLDVLPSTNLIVQLRPNLNGAWIPTGHQWDAMQAAKSA